MSRPLRVALLQLEAYDLDGHELAWAQLLERIDDAAADEPDLIVLPEASYPAYFLGSLEEYEAAGVRPDAEVLATLGQRARRYGCHIAAGLVLRGEDGGLENACVLFDPEGAVVGRYAKSFLWHFDRRWFSAGDTFPVFRIGEATAGILICADGRLPEIPRAFADAGANLIIDPTAWVSWGRTREALSQPLADYFMPARAIESGAWVVCAAKVGVEAGSIVYAGQSGVIDPRGEWVVRAPGAEPGVVVYTLDLDEATGPPIERAPPLPPAEAASGDRSRAAKMAREALISEDAVARVVSVALDPSPSAVELMEGVRALVRTVARQDAALVVLPDLAGTDARAVTQLELLPLLSALSEETQTMLAAVLAERVEGATYKTLYLLERGAVLAAHRQTQLSPAEQAAGFAAGATAPPVVETIVGNLGLLSSAEGLAPELARTLKLEGAELLLWCAGDIGAPLRTLTRARAHENRLYVAAAGDTGTSGGGYVVDPAGGVIAETLEGEAMAAGADINRLFARWNDMAPGTNPLRDAPPGLLPGSKSER